ncbi:MAG: alpha/beta hydrolase [Gammaproteobacteria bacterium]|nr:alpha/beta hydrolase [Gammaproteobacteria bacterium]
MNEPREHRVRVRDIEIAWFEWGDPGSQPVVLAHATGFHARCWNAVAKVIGSGYRAIALDQRGHGRSSKAGPYDWRAFGEDLAGFVDQLDLHEAIGVGHSMGGHAIVQAASSRVHRFERLVLIDPVILAPEAYRSWPSFAADSHPVARRRADFGSWTELYDRLRDRPPFALWRSDVLRDYCRHGVVRRPDGGVTLACPPTVESAIYAGSGGTDIYREIRSLPHEVLVVRAPPREASPAQMDFSRSPTWHRLAAAFPRGRDAYRADLTHFIPMQEPDFVARAIAEPDVVSCA